MSGNIRYPNITAPTEAGQLKQVHSYLRQLVDQINWALEHAEGINTANSPVPKKTGTAASAGRKDDPISSFNSIKGLIIKSADIVNAYYEKIDNLLKLSGEYVAEATFPDGSARFVEATNLAVNASSQAIEQLFKNVQKITSDIEAIGNSIVDVNAHINSGLLYYDKEVPVYGVEVGQRTQINGKEVFNKYARFTASKLSFYDQNGNEVAFISDRKLHITSVEVEGEFIMGGFVDEVQPDKSIVTKWR